MNKLEDTKVERTKMPRINRASQFAPFNSLRDLPDSISGIEKENEKTSKNDVDEQTSIKISNNLMNLNKSSSVYLRYFFDGYVYEYFGKIKIDFEKQIIVFDKIKLPIKNILDLDIIGELTY